MESLKWSKQTCNAYEALSYVRMTVIYCSDKKVNLIKEELEKVSKERLRQLEKLNQDYKIFQSSVDMAMKKLEDDEKKFQSLRDRYLKELITESKQILIRKSTLTIVAPRLDLDCDLSTNNLESILELAINDTKKKYKLGF